MSRKHETEELRRLVNKKGIGFFLHADEETRERYEGILYRDGFLNLSLIEFLTH